MKKANEFVEHLGEVFRLFGPVRAKRMFGGFGIYHHELMIGLVADDTLYLKADAQSAPLFAQAGSRPFEYNKSGKLMKMSYWAVPVEIYDEPDAARRWASVALEAALRSRARTARHRAG